MTQLARLALCCIALAILDACSSDVYYAATYPASQFDHTNQ
jgi:hypothetical protein